MDTLYWVLFNGFVVVMLLVDLFIFNRKNHVIKIKEALIWSAFWILLSLTFNVLIYFWKGPVPALEFLTGYLIEKSLSVDNLFVFLMVFSYFRVPDEYQHKVLFWGIFGALFFRAIFIFAGISLIENFHFTVYILGAFLIFAGLKMLLQKEMEGNPGNNFMIKVARRFIPILKEYQGDKFFVTRNSVIYATPLFMVLLVIETTDIVFAVDSIPAILAISTDSFIVYTSNIFALLGLRALYFALSGVMQLFHYLKFGLSVILIFVGIKIAIQDFYKIDILFALGFVGGVLLLSVLMSIVFPKKVELEDKKDL